MKKHRRSASNAGVFNVGVLQMSWLGPEAVGDVGAVVAASRAAALQKARLRTRRVQQT
jgi:hypothetical protein